MRSEQVSDSVVSNEHRWILWKQLKICKKNKEYFKKIKEFLKKKLKVFLKKSRNVEWIPGTGSLRLAHPPKKCPNKKPVLPT